MHGAGETTGEPFGAVGGAGVEAVMSQTLPSVVYYTDGTAEEVLFRLLS